MGDLKTVIPFVAAIAFLLGYWFGRKSNASKIEEILYKVEAGKIKVQRAIDRNKQFSPSGEKVNKRKKENIMADKSLDEILEAITAADTVDDSLIVLTADIKRRLKEALEGVTIPPAAQAKINAIFDGIEAGKAKVAEAVVANTDAA